MDLKIFFWLNNFAGQNRLFDWLFVFFAHYLAYMLVLVFIIFLCLSRRERTRRIYWCVTAAAAALVARLGLTELIRLVYHRPRPFITYSVHQLIPESGWSFPSGHASFFFAFSTIVYFYNKPLGYWFLAASALMGLARIIAGVHYLSDVLAGALVGWLVGLVLYKVFRRWYN